ncbi:hypothetical protein CC1G_08335 [Coprinopsis cinerea okayama7|uniref:Flavin-containing monooxygenase n=1 Tax=Coprinopsis cinerea (strain Okayama-7 / 130 / ATCC MYA-4618 / FGSC 9003) TaxID=240176 RepID=A8NA77_COPC7|nr:hypothetical protein CC1G_08335 [Coprinopsis cinerea okayama7\|eukprot:XP_001831731.2 hypothetical protein CC1G_08335 [Coprinopsis cinerea okayama7\
MSHPPAPDTTSPALSLVGTTLPEDFDPTSFDSVTVARGWFSMFQSAVANQSIPGAVMGLFIPEATGIQVWWRDMLALTWDFRTFIGHSKIRRFATDRLFGPTAQFEVDLHDLELVTAESDSALPPAFIQPEPDFAWIQLFFSFKTKSGLGSGIARIVPVGVTDANGLQDAKNWKAHTIYTNLEALAGHPEAIGLFRNQQLDHGDWELSRRKEIDCEGEAQKPVVLIVGAGHNGLAVAARLKMLGMKSLIIEQSERVGDGWRNRYGALCLHQPIWNQDLPYLPFPPNWPLYVPAAKMSNWLEHYAEIMELNVWLSSSIRDIRQDPDSQKWDVSIVRKLKGVDGTVLEETRRFHAVHHLILAIGEGNGLPEIPHIEGLHKFKDNGGVVLHSTEYKRASEYAGKRVIVVGASSSAHDICAECYRNNIDATMIQRSSTYIMSKENGWKVYWRGLYSENSRVGVVDRVVESHPYWSRSRRTQMQTQEIAELDKCLLARLHKAGFKTNLGVLEAGFTYIIPTGGGALYLDSGACNLIADGKIKLKSDSQIKEFTERGLIFEDGSELEGDVVVFATGHGNSRERLRHLLGDDLAARFTGLWGLDEEGEIIGAWRDVGIERLWCMRGGFVFGRFFSKHVALQIKAQEEGLFGQRYRV